MFTPIIMPESTIPVTAADTKPDTEVYTRPQDADSRRYAIAYEAIPSWVASNPNRLAQGRSKGFWPLSVARRKAEELNAEFPHFVHKVVEV